MFGALGAQYSDPPFHCLHDALSDMKETVFMTMGTMKLSYTCAVLHTDLPYYVFDPHSQNSLGMAAADGKATMTVPQTVAELQTFFNNLSKSVNIVIDSAFEITPVKLAYACKPASDYDCSSVFSGFSVMSDSELDKVTKVQENQQKKVSDISRMSYSLVKLDCNISETYDSYPLFNSDDEIPLSTLQPKDDYPMPDSDQGYMDSSGSEYDPNTQILTVHIMILTMTFPWLK